MTPRAIRFLIAAFAVVVALPAFAAASWNSNGSGGGYSKARSVASGNTPTTSVSNRSVTVNWTGTGGGVPVTGYIVKRYTTGGALQTIGSNCSGTVATTSCTENAVPPGNWRYTVTPVRQNWQGTESGQSTAVTVNAPALTVSPTNVTSLPQVLTGSISGYVPGQTVTFKLDNQTTGQVLTGSITPSSVPANGNATVSVTLPNTVSNGPHTIFAVGSGTDVASANVTVAVPTTITTSAYDLRDFTSAAQVDATQEVAIANDGRTLPTSNWNTSFSGTRYVDFYMNSPLRGASSITSADLNFRFATGSVTSLQGCFYVEVRKASDDTLLSTHGAASPFCTTLGATQTSFTVPLASVTTGAIANNLKIRVFGRTSTLGTTFVTDLATVSGTGADGNFTLFPDRTDNKASGASVLTPWSIFQEDSVAYTVGTDLQTSYDAGRYLRATFPAYVPAGSTITSATLTHAYRSSRNGRGVCNYVGIFAGATEIGTHGAASDLSCNSSSTVNQVDTISLPEVDTVPEANSLSARIYLRRESGGPARRSVHDQIRLSITYVK